MSRGDLLMVAERAVDLVPRSRLAALVGDRVRPEDLAPAGATAASLLDEVKRFHAQSLAGNYYESFAEWTPPQLATHKRGLIHTFAENVTASLYLR